MNIFIRILLALAALAVALFCLFGFLASFEAGPPVLYWTFRILYAVVGLSCLIAVARLLWLRKQTS